MMQIQSRIQHIQEQIAASEGSSIDCMQAQEDLRREISAMLSKYKTIQVQLTEKRRNNAEVMLKLTAQLKELEDMRSKLRSTFDQQILAVYDDLTRKKGNAVASLNGDICSGCRVSVSINKLRKVEAGTAMVYCDTCSRLLIPVE